MAVFDTPRPISVTIELPFGALHLIATRRSDTVVVVNPTDPSRKADVEAADRTRVDLAGDALVVRAPKTGGLGNYIGLAKPGSVDMTIELPEDSRVEISAGFADVRTDGPLADTRVRSGAGDVRLDETSALEVIAGAGTVTVGRATANTEITAAGDIQIGTTEGDAEIKNLNGKTWVGEVSGRLRVKSANGDIAVDRALSDVAVRTANGNIHIGEVVRGSTTLVSASGGLEIGIGHGTAAWVDARTRFGRVHNALEVAGGPDPSRDTVEVRARTSFGDISVNRSRTSSNQGDEE